ncbi:hypothetical protein [Flavivirga rizhaonensis]|uniref:Uncharacterized protein n=1 Tax=Flavivirga rizhaonensis TaxID=2559571 RepID=A0A4S1E020_9FLAO|nr:hypothetical protein [Flavivirga rizhaonensis]TGV03623.1 hypothetical protein EM932_06250 [Flavivirga rizhaonensis]
MPSSCSAKRSGDLKFSISPLKFLKFNLNFMGSGTSIFDEDLDFKKLEKNKLYRMVWASNTFIGKHWLLGKFKITLNKNNQSFGLLDNSKVVNNRTQAINTNHFYFDFNFPRLFNLKMSNIDPIINSAIVFDIPPTHESVFTLDEKSQSSKFKLSKNNSLNLYFDYCEVTAYPERNIKIEVLTIDKLSKNKFQIKFKYGNLTIENVVASYFTVMHEEGLKISNDYGFRKLKPKESFMNTVVLEYTGIKKKVNIPFFAGIYKPIEHKGADSKVVELNVE